MSESSLMLSVRWRYRLLVPLGALAGLLACHVVTLQGPHAMPGNGPNGTPLRTTSEVAVGLNPAPDTPPVYPVTARVDITEQYHGVQVVDPYRWLEELDSVATREWVDAQNRVSQPRLAS